VNYGSGLGVSVYDKCVRFPMKFYGLLIYVAALSLTDCIVFLLLQKEFLRLGFGVMLCIRNDLNSAAFEVFCIQMATVEYSSECAAVVKKLLNNYFCCTYDNQTGGRIIPLPLMGIICAKVAELGDKSAVTLDMRQRIGDCHSVDFFIFR